MESVSPVVVLGGTASGDAGQGRPDSGNAQRRSGRRPLPKWFLLVGLRRQSRLADLVTRPPKRSAKRSFGKIQAHVLGRFLVLSILNRL